MIKTKEQALEWLFKNQLYVTQSMKFSKELLDQFTSVYKILTGRDKNMNCGSCFMNAKKELIKFIPESLVVEEVKEEQGEEVEEEVSSVDTPTQEETQEETPKKKGRPFAKKQ